MLSSGATACTIKTRRYLAVPNNVLIVSYCYRIGGARDSFFLLVETIKNRNQCVEFDARLFLIVFLMAALVMVVSSFLFEPKNDSLLQR
jgi:hypothetical protein